MVLILVAAQILLHKDFSLKFNTPEYLNYQQGIMLVFIIIYIICIISTCYTYTEYMHTSQTSSLTILRFDWERNHLQLQAMKPRYEQEDSSNVPWGLPLIIITYTLAMTLILAWWYHSQILCHYQTKKFWKVWNTGKLCVLTSPLATLIAHLFIIGHNTWNLDQWSM